MKVRTICIGLVLGAAMSVAACDVTNPNRPTVTFAAPTASSPSNGTIYNFNQQPVTLTIVNVAKTGDAVVTYTLEVAATTTFAAKTFSREGIAEGSGGTTAVTISALDGNTTYYWRYKAVIDGVVGEPSATQSFFVRPNIVISAPTAVEPLSGDIFAARPVFTVNNAARTGQPGTIFYEFQVSNNAGFSPLVASATIQEQSGRTSWTPVSDLPEGSTFWRVRATDPQNAVTSPFSSTAQFTRKFGLDLASVTYNLGPSIANWQQTRTITSAGHFGDQLCIESEGEDWPATGFPFDNSVAVEGNQWNFVQINGKWYGGAGHWYRPGQTCKGEVDDRYFSEGFQGAQPISSVQMHPGDVFAVALSTPARAWPAAKTLDHRSNVVFVVW